MPRGVWPAAASFGKEDAVARLGGIQDAVDKYVEPVERDTTVRKQAGDTRAGHGSIGVDERSEHEGVGADDAADADTREERGNYVIGYIIYAIRHGKSSILCYISAKYIIQKESCKS